jgi:hypothetical protein
MLTLRGLLSMIIPIGISRKTVGKKVKKYNRLNYVDVKLKGGYLNGPYKAWRISRL